MSRLADGLLRHFIPHWQEHLSDERIASLMGRELTFVEAWAAKRHLAQCRNCRDRQWCLEGPRATRMMQLYGEMISGDDLHVPLPDQPRAAFEHWLELQTRPAMFSAQGATHSNSFSKKRFFVVVSQLSVGVALGVAVTAIVFTYWWRQRVPGITANSLLVHAETWDSPGPTAHPGVAHQRIRIKTALRTFERSLYWDVQGKRRPRHASSAGEEGRLKLALDRAGVDWDRPISAAAYQDWHDHQHVRSDRITHSGAHLLTLTTTVPEGAVLEESITVRETDFHPIERTVDFRDNGTVEIAEVDFHVVPWGATDENAFEPIEDVPNHGVAALPPRAPASHLAQTSSVDQLDQTELTARLILNQLHADTGEQIEVRRSERGVEVKGLVETEERKKELSTQLMSVPRLQVSLESATDLRNAPSTGGDAIVVEAVSLPDQPSALETYMRKRGRGTEEINRFARNLFEAARAITQESTAILEVKAHFRPASQMSVINLAMLVELLYNHHERLEAALRQERMQLAEIEQAPGTGGAASVADELPLAVAADKNLALARELTQTNVAEVRNAETIIADMTVMLGRLSPAVRQAYLETQVNPDLGKKE